MNYWDWAQAALGAYEAYQGSKDKKSDPKDAWRGANPDVYSPFYNVNTDWNNGKPTITQTLNPNVQQILDSLVFGHLQNGRTPYGMSDGMRDIYGAQQNWQRERYGLPPTSNPSGYGGTGPNSFSGGTAPSGVDQGYIDDVSESDRTSDSYRDADLGNRTVDEFNYLGGGGRKTGGSSTGPVGGPKGYDHLGSGGSEEIIKQLLSLLGNQLFPGAGTGLGMLMDNYNFDGKQGGIMSPDSPDYVARGGNTGALSQDFLPGVNVPGSLADMIANYQFGQGNNSNFLTPVDNSGQGRVGAQGNSPYLADGNVRGDIMPDQGYNNAASPRPMFGGYNSYDPRGSITGGGAFNYATRLGPRPLGSQG